MPQRARRGTSRQSGNTKIKKTRGGRSGPRPEPAFWNRAIGPPDGRSAKKVDRGESSFETLKDRLSPVKLRWRLRPEKGVFCCPLHLNVKGKPARKIQPNISRSLLWQTKIRTYRRRDKIGVRLAHFSQRVKNLRVRLVRLSEGQRGQRLISRIGPSDKFRRLLLRARNDLRDISGR